MTLLSQYAGGAPAADGDCVVVKVHYRYSLALRVPVDTPLPELKEQLAHKLGQAASGLRLR